MTVVKENLIKDKYDKLKNALLPGNKILHDCNIYNKLNTYLNFFV